MSDEQEVQLEPAAPIKRDFFQRFNIPDLIKKASLVYLILKVISVALTVSGALGAKMDPTRIFGYTVDQLLDVLWALVFWGIAQFLTVARKHDEDKNS